MASSSSGSSKPVLIRKFVRMGFLEKLVVKAIKDNGEDNAEAMLKTLLTHSATENFLSTNFVSFESGSDFPDGLSDGDCYLGNEENANHFTSRKDMLLCHFLEMGYSDDEILAAIDKCGLDTPIAELMDFICAAQIAKEADAFFPPEDDVTIVQTPTNRMPRTDYFPRETKRKLHSAGRQDNKRCRIEKQINEDDDKLHLPNPMVGFGVPNVPWGIVRKELPMAATGPPYFYYENVALAPNLWILCSSLLLQEREVMSITSLFTIDTLCCQSHRALSESTTFNKEMVASMGPKNKVQLPPDLHWEYQAHCQNTGSA